MFLSSPEIYDAIYEFKDYAAEARLVESWIRAQLPDARSLLDLACGTGAHLVSFAETFEHVEGLDLNRTLAAGARAKLPATPIHVADMRDFALGRRFDAVTCLFSAIGYLIDITEFERAFARFAEHLEPGGVLVVEGWIAPEQVQPHGVWMRAVDHPELKIARMNTVEVDGHIMRMDLHHLVGTPEGVRGFVETHELALYEPEQYRAAIEAAGLQVVDRPEGLMGRGNWVARRP